MFGRTSFRGGIHPPLYRERTAQSPIEPLPPPSKVIINLLQHAGTAAHPIVKSGDRVRIGQMIGEPSGPVCAPVHASVCGKVLTIGKFPCPDGQQRPAIEIENDNSNEMVEMQPIVKSWREAAFGELIQAIADAGVVGTGGDAVPTHVKLSLPSDKRIKTVIVNGVEDEPFITADSRLMVEKTEDILTGSLIVKKIIGAQRVVFAFGTLQHRPIARLSEVLKKQSLSDVSICRCKQKYPQGAEKLLTLVIEKKFVPSGGAPSDIGCIVLNVATVHAVFNAVCSGIPLYQRVVTVSGPAIRRPKNLLVPIGTPLRQAIDFCEIDMEKVNTVVMGGAMTGCAQSDLDVSVQKTTSGIIAFDQGDDHASRSCCINCGNCVKICPMRLVPSFLAKFVGNNKLGDAVSWGIADCIECGSCAYVCPSKINLVHFMKLGKYLVGQNTAAVYSTIES